MICQTESSHTLKIKHNPSFDHGCVNLRQKINRISVKKEEKLNENNERELNHFFVLFFWFGIVIPFLFGGYLEHKQI